MGIKGLLAGTKSVGIPSNISHFQYKRAGIDGYSWIHKAMHSGDLQIYTHNNITSIYKYFSKKIKHFQKLNIEIILIFDGAEMPLKKNTNQKRRHQ